jgi:hypothetical protein
VPSFTCFLFAAGDGAAADLFIPVLILSTPTLEQVTVATSLDTEASEVAAAFGGTPVPGTTPAFGTGLE